LGGVVRLLTVREVAERLAVCTATVYALVERGEIRHLRVSNAIRIHPDDFATYLNLKRR
jgi:excisionase family DNA binding protein